MKLYIDIISLVFDYNQIIIYFGAFYYLHEFWLQQTLEEHNEYKRNNAGKPNGAYDGINRPE